MSGKTENLFLVEPLTRGGLNWGYVGEIKQVNADVILKTINERKVPVVSPISADKKGESYNVNADNAAAALAAAVRCTDLIFITDVPGVLVDDEIRPSLSVQKAQALIASGTIKGGMVAKLKSAFEALHQNVPRVHITQWQGPQTLHKIIKDKPETGTTITP
jgi:acetylglutamate kinase